MLTVVNVEFVDEVLFVEVVLGLTSAVEFVVEAVFVALEVELEV